MEVSETITIAEVAPEETAAIAPYASSNEHLWEELRRIDLLLRAQTVRWRLTIAATKPEELWGMVHVTEAEIDTYLQTSFVPPDSLPAPLAESLQDYWHEADLLKQHIRRRVAATPATEILRLEQLALLCGLSDQERDIMLVCLLPELDVRYRRLLGYLQDDVSKTSPTVELLLQILYPVINDLELGRSCFESESALSKQQMLVTSGDDALVMRSVRLDPGIIGFLLGGDGLDLRLIPVSVVVAPVTWERVVVEVQLLEKLQDFARWWQKNHNQSGGATLFLHGPTGAGRLLAAQAICGLVGSRLLVVDAEKVARSNLHFEQLVDLINREAHLRGAAIYWSHCETLLDPAQQPQLWNYLINSNKTFPGLFFLASSTHWEPSGQFRERTYQRFEFPLPSYKLRRRLWEDLLPPDTQFLDPARDRAGLAEQLANGFQLTGGQILDVLDTARELAFQRDPQKPLIGVNDLYEGCRRQSNRQLITFARRIEPRTELTFQDLIMPEPNRVQLLELRSRIRHRSRVYTGFGFERRLTLGKGLIALFTGSSGTGKTMAAELLAREQGVDLYKVDLSAVVSKYVGETEKNLSRVFTDAEDANAIIFFDEADALFGKRGEVKEAQDRWANMEVNYLLQRVEEYAGVVILASNLRQNIDEAFSGGSTASAKRSVQTRRREFEKHRPGRGVSCAE
jgi:ATPase family associated with various cellular activities (AAA)